MGYSAIDHPQETKFHKYFNGHLACNGKSIYLLYLRFFHHLVDHYSIYCLQSTKNYLSLIHKKALFKMLVNNHTFTLKTFAL